jgi:hypothetical protein
MGLSIFDFNVITRPIIARKPISYGCHPEENKALVRRFYAEIDPPCISAAPAALTALPAMSLAPVAPFAEASVFVQNYDVTRWRGRQGQHLDAMDELVAEDYLDHNPPRFPGLKPGRRI